MSYRKTIVSQAFVQRVLMETKALGQPLGSREVILRNGVSSLDQVYRRRTLDEVLADDVLTLHQRVEDLEVLLKDAGAALHRMLHGAGFDQGCMSAAHLVLARLHQDDHERWQAEGPGAKRLCP